MSLTAEMLAEEIKRLGHCAPLSSELIACDLLPFIERHIVAGQQGITAEWVKGYFQNSYTTAANLQAVDDAFAEWAALHPTATPQQPKPAGAVFGWINPVDAQKASRSRSKREGSAIAVFVSTERTETYSMAIYTNPTPAADAGWVTVTVTDEFVERLARQMMRERYPNDSAVSLDHSFEGNAIYRETWIARARKILTAALTPEVRHGE